MREQSWNVVRYGVGKQSAVIRYGDVDVYYGLDPEAARKAAETLNHYRYDQRQGLDWVEGQTKGERP